MAHISAATALDQTQKLGKAKYPQNQSTYGGIGPHFAHKTFVVETFADPWHRQEGRGLATLRRMLPVREQIAFMLAELRDQLMNDEAALMERFGQSVANRCRLSRSFANNIFVPVEAG